MNLTKQQSRFTRSTTRRLLAAALVASQAFGVALVSTPRATAQAKAPDAVRQGKPAKKKPKQGPTKHPFLWRIDARDGKPLPVQSWLYGTMHIGDRRLVTLPEVVNKARENADALYCELDMQNMGKMQLKMTKRMLLPKGQVLEDVLPADLYRRLGRYLRKHGASIDRFKRLKVWAVSLTMATLDIAKLGYVHSLDQMIFKEARADGLEVGGLETTDEQLNAFTGSSQEDQIAALRNGLKLGEEYDAKGANMMAEMLETYLSGDTKQLLVKLEESGKHDPELSKRMMEPLLAGRNFKMAKRMDEKMKAYPKKSYFFAVGALHYPGKNGLLELLKKKGYKITRMNPPPEKPQRADKGAKKTKKPGRAPAPAF